MGSGSGHPSSIWRVPPLPCLPLLTVVGCVPIGVVGAQYTVQPANGCIVCGPQVCLLVFIAANEVVQQETVVQD